MAVKPKGVIALAALVLLALGVSAGSLLAAGPEPQTVAPKATIEIVPVPANAANPNALMATLADGSRVAEGTSGLPVVPIGVPVLLRGSATDAKVPVDRYAWTLSKPRGSEAVLEPGNEPQVRFTPDVSGTYKVDLVLSNSAGASPMASVQIRAGQYIGVEAGNCAKCHPGQVAEWGKTGHGVIFKTEVNGGENPSISHYGERCVRCHTTGYYPGADNGGFGGVQAATGWQFPALEAIQTGKGQWEAVPEALKSVSNIQCEACHGPAKDHVEKGAKMAASLDNGVCNQCHDGGGHHIKGSEVRFAKHSDEESQAWTYPVGPSRQDCVRCHSGAGYVSFIKNPKEVASWDNSMETVGCSVCHEPHSEANVRQLRIVGKPVEAAGITKDFGMSATCVECHNGRTTAADAQKASFPHYSAAGEMLADMGGVTYGQRVPNSAHGMVVGSAPMASPDVAAESAALFARATPGPCVVCHMWPGLADAKDPNYMKVGEHSFNVVSPDGKVQNTASCQACHQQIQNINLTARADYDGNGKAEGVQQEVAGLLGKLKKAIADSGVKPVTGHPYFDRADVAKANEKQKNAIYNYQFVRGLDGSEGKAAAIHNFKRSVALLQLSFKDLTGGNVPGATLMND